MQFESSRLSFRPMDESHFDFFFRLDSDPEIMTFIRRPSADRGEARERFERILSYSLQNPGRGAFVVNDRSGKPMGIGFLVHLEMNPENIDYEVGYRLARETWGQGFATEIARRLIQYAFEELKMTTLYATTNPNHVVSQKVLLKAGMLENGMTNFYGGSKFFVIHKKFS